MSGFDARYGDGGAYGENELPGPNQPVVRLEQMGATSLYMIFGIVAYVHPLGIPFGAVRWLVEEPLVKYKDTGFLTDPSALLHVVSGAPGSYFKVRAQVRDANGIVSPLSAQFGACLPACVPGITAP